MLAPFATLAFLTVLWVSAFVFAEMFGRSGSRILAAVRGETPLAPTAIVIISMRATRPVRSRRALRAQPQLRVAA